MLSKLFVLLLAMVLVLQLIHPGVPVNANSIAGSWDNIYWKYNQDDRELVISGEGPMPHILNLVRNYGYDIIPWWWCRDEIETVRIEEGITVLQNCWLDFCGNLKSIYVPATLESFDDPEFCVSMERYEVHPDNAYYCDVDGILFNKDQTTLVCYPATKSGAYVIPDTVTELEGFAFDGCINLTAVTIPNGIAKIKSSTFYNCDSLTSVIIPDSVTEVASHAFARCDNLEYIKFSKNIKRIGAYAFQGLPKITNLELPPTLYRIDAGAFAECTSLQSITVYNKVRQIKGSAFDKNDNWTDVFFIGTEEDFQKVENNWLFTMRNLHYGTSGALDNGIRWELKANDKALFLTGSGNLTGSESLWRDYAEYYSKVYAAKGISGVENCVGQELGSCGTATVDGVQYTVYARRNTVTYDANGIADAPLAQSQIHGQMLTLSDKKPVRQGYVFAGWSADKRATKAEYAPGAKMESLQDITLYAVWKERKITSISVVNGPQKAVYQLGEELALEGMVVRAYYNDGTWVDVTGECTVSGYDCQTAGEQSIIVQYGGLKAYTTVTVLPEDVTLVGMEPVVSKTSYIAGEAFDETSVTLKLLFSDGSAQTITEGFRIEGFCSDAAGAVKLTVFYGELSAAFEITVEAPVPDEDPDRKPSTEVTRGIQSEPSDSTPKKPQKQETEEPARQIWLMAGMILAAVTVAVMVIIVLVKVGKRKR